MPKKKPTAAATAPAKAGRSSAADPASAMTAMAAQLGDTWKTLAGVTLPPDALASIQSDYMRQAQVLWNGVLQPGAASGSDATSSAPPGDRRFAAAEWASSSTSSFTSGMYLLNARTLMHLAKSVEADEKTKARIRFAVLQWVDAASPANYLALNPEAQKKAVDSRGASLMTGLSQLWSDVQQGHLSQTDESAFEVGRNVATTEGSVVFENELFQLLDYKPLTAKIHERPILFVPPCINKFYILDLQPENSLIRHTVAEGHRVFVLSWKNAGPEIAQRTWDDYIEHAAVRAIGLVQEISGSRTINTLGFCIGGTILATALAVLAARGERPAASLTLLTTFLDFSDTGILDIFVDESSVRLREMTLGPQSPGGGNLLKGQELANTFSMLRPNDLVWNYVVGNYLKGDKPPAFDLLYWNGDGTNLPGPMYCWYLRNTYLENNLKTPGKVTVCGEPLDLGAINVPTYVYGSREDHIVPWQGAYRSVALLTGKRRFVLGASGHIAGVINPPAKKKRSHWIGRGAALPASAEEWFETATEHPGSWWTDWSAWLAGFGGKQIAAPKSAGGGRHKAIEPAPGRYVKEKA